MNSDIENQPCDTFSHFRQRPKKLIEVQGNLRILEKDIEDDELGLSFQNNIVKYRISVNNDHKQFPFISKCYQKRIFLRILRSMEPPLGSGIEMLKT